MRLRKPHFSNLLEPVPYQFPELPYRIFRTNLGSLVVSLTDASLVAGGFHADAS
jgi:hypothetical protein